MENYSNLQLDFVWNWLILAAVDTCFSWMLSTQVWSSSFQELHSALSVGSFGPAEISLMHGTLFRLVQNVLQDFLLRIPSLSQNKSRKSNHAEKKNKCPGPQIMRSLLSGWYHSPKLDCFEIKVQVTQWIGDGKAKNLNTLCVSLAVSCNDFLHNLAQSCLLHFGRDLQKQWRRSNVTKTPAQKFPIDMGVLHLSIC